MPSPKFGVATNGARFWCAANHSAAIFHDANRHIKRAKNEMGAFAISQRPCGSQYYADKIIYLCFVSWLNSVVIDGVAAFAFGFGQFHPDVHSMANYSIISFKIVYLFSTGGDWFKAERKPKSSTHFEWVMWLPCSIEYKQTKFTSTQGGTFFAPFFVVTISTQTKLIPYILAPVQKLLFSLFQRKWFEKKKSQRTNWYSYEIFINQDLRELCISIYRHM